MNWKECRIGLTLFKLLIQHIPGRTQEIQSSLIYPATGKEIEPRTLRISIAGLNNLAMISFNYVSISEI